MENFTLNRFKAICVRHGIPEKFSLLVFEELLARYSEPHRAYHNFNHVDRMLGLFVDREIPDDEIEFAIWFHDVIYDPRGQHNERKSADFFLARFDGFLWSEFTREVERLIMATDPTIKSMGTNRENLMIDIDLSILGSDPEEYQEYAKSVRKEYDYVSDEEFCKGRGKFLREILKQDIYASRQFKQLEEQARVNIQAEIHRLELGFL